MEFPKVPRKCTQMCRGNRYTKRGSRGGGRNLFGAIHQREPWPRTRSEQRGGGASAMLPNGHRMWLLKLHTAAGLNRTSSRRTSVRARLLFPPFSPPPLASLLVSPPSLPRSRERPCLVDARYLHMHDYSAGEVHRCRFTNIIRHSTLQFSYATRRRGYINQGREH